MKHVVIAHHLVGRGYAVSDKAVRFDRWILAAERSSLQAPDGEEVRLSRCELKLLEAFLERPDEIMTREQLLELTVGLDTDVFDRCIDSQVRRLRRKIEKNPAQPAIIRTHWRLGYRFAAEVCWEQRDTAPSRNTWPGRPAYSS